MTQRFDKLLERMCFDIHRSGTLRVIAPHRPGLEIYARLTQGFPDSDPAGRAFSVLEMAVPKYEMYLTAHSDYTASSSEWSDRYRFISLYWMHGLRKKHQTLMFHEAQRKREKYQPRVAEKLRQSGDKTTPWITFALHGSLPEPAHPDEFPLLHCVDLREWVEDKNRDVVVVGGETYVNMAGQRPYGTGGGEPEMMLKMLVAFLPGEPSDFWGLLNSAPYVEPRTRRRIGPYQRVVQCGRFEHFKRLKKKSSGYACAQGRFVELEQELTTPWLSEDEINEKMASLMKDQKVSTVVDGVPTTMSARAAKELATELQCELSRDSLILFLSHVARIQAGQSSMDPAKPYGAIIRLAHELDPGAVEEAAGHLLSTPSKIRVPLMRVLPASAVLPQVKTVKWIASRHGISRNTVMRRLSENGVRLVKGRNRQPGIFADEYAHHKLIFKTKC